MISVDIISKIVSKGTGKAPSTVGGEPNMDLSDYLLKEIWEKVFEIKTDAAGNEYIFGKLPVVTKYGITMYGDGEGGSSVPSYSTLGSLLNVDESNDAVASVDRVLFQSAGSNEWSWKALSEIGGGSSGGGSVSGDYLPLSGGTLTSTDRFPLILTSSYSSGAVSLILKNTNVTNESGDSTGSMQLAFTTSAGAFLFNYYNYSAIGIGNDGTPFVGYGGSLTEKYAILHAGNISSYNAGSATKLQTARIIWGQEFDGTGDVSGDLTVGNGNLILNNNKELQCKNTNGENVSIITYSNNNALSIGNGVAKAGRALYIRGLNVYLQYGTNHTPGLYLKNTGNVLIGTDTDSGYKLDVNGTVQITNQGDGVKLLRFNTERPWVFKQVGTGVGANLVLQAEHDAKAFIIAHGSGKSAVEFFTGGSAYTAFNTVVRPKVSDSIDLGAVNYYWNNSYINNGYFSNKLEINGIPVYKLQDNVLYIDSNLVVRGGITMYGGEFDSTDIMDAIVTDETTILNDNGVLKLSPNIQLGGISSSEVLSIVSGAGYITSSALSGYLPKSGGMIENTVADALSLKRQNSSAGVYISFNNSTNGWLGGIGIGGSSTSIGIQPFVMLQSGTHQIYHSGNLTKLSQLTDDVVNGKYLPLSGGTITTSNIALTINRTGVLNSAIRYMIDGVEQGSLGFYKTLGLAYYDATNVGWYKIWHEHNDGSGSGLDADLLDGKHNGELTAAFVNAQALTTDIDTPANLPGTGVYINNSGAEIGTCGTYDTVLTVGTAGRIFQFKGTKDSDIIQYRGASGNNGLRGWKTLLHSDNYSSYALPITGGTLEGALTVKGLIRSSVVNSASASWSQYLNYANASIGVDTISATGVHPIIGWATSNGSYTTRMVIGSTSGSTTFGDMYFAVGTNSAGTSGRRLILYSTGICYWEGDIVSTGGITMYSDIRKKTKLQDVELNLSQIANAPLIQHYYNSDQEKTTHVGSIAQYWAGMNDWFCKLDNEGFYTMEIQNCALASAISIARELVKYESRTDRTIRKMKQRIQELEDEVERLKQN